MTRSKITPNHIRKNTVTGFSHVGFVGGPSRSNTTSYYQAFERGGRKGDWKGPRRSTAGEAAQDYCNYINGNGVAPVILKRANKSERPKHRRELSPREKALRAELRKELKRNPPKAVHDPLVYLIGIKGESAVKIGYAEYNVHSRLDSLQTGNHRQLLLLATILGDKTTEYELHRRFQKWNILNEWFEPKDSLLAAFKLNRVTYERLMA